MSLLQLLLKPAGRTLWEVASHLPNLGVGSRVTRKAWEPYGDSFWRITAVQPGKNIASDGKVYGVLTWRGVEQPTPRSIGGASKKVWRYMPSEQERLVLQQLARQLQQKQQLARLAAQSRSGAAEAAAGGSGGGS